MGLVTSPLRYPGGKSKAVNFLKNFFPVDFKELREPMCGGASITLYWAQVKPFVKYIIGDKNFDLYCFWKELKERPEKLIKEILSLWQSYKDGRKLYEEILQRRPYLSNDTLQRAVDFFVLNRITFSGTTDSGGYSEEAFRKRFTSKSIEKLYSVSKILQRIEVYHGDYSQLLREEGENVVIFLDPPYYSSRGSKLYGNKGTLHTEFDHYRLKEEVLKCKHKILITYDNSKEIKELYMDFYIVGWKLKYGMANYGKNYLREGDELLIANYPLGSYLENLQKQPSMFQKVVIYTSWA